MPDTPHGGGPLTISIHLHDHLLANGRDFHRIGRTADARCVLRRLLAASDVAPPVRAEANSLLGELEFSLGNYRQARRHFAAVMGLRPYDTESCLRYADAVDADSNADPHKGWMARRRATRIDSFDSRCWSALGQSGLRIGDRKRALRAFRRAARLRPERVETLTELVDGFMTLGHTRDAAAVLNCARFRCPHDSGIRALWNRFRFDILRMEQNSRRDQSDLSECTVLPFPGRTSNAASECGQPVVLRADRRSRTAPHLLRLLGMRIDPRRAN